MATSTQLVSPAEALPVQHVALPLVFSKLEVGPLCVAACVARAWRTAAATPQLWRRPLLPRDTLTDAQLARIVARCGAHLQELDVSCCLRVTLHGVLQALRPAPRLSALHVRGVLYLPANVTEQTRDDAWAAIRGCVRDDAPKPLDMLSLTACGWAEPQPRAMCNRLLGEQDVCSRCTTALCFSCNEWTVAHGHPATRGNCVFQCAGCQVLLCGQHITAMETAGCDFCRVNVCDGCKPEADECKETWRERMGWSQGPWHYRGAHPSLRPALCRRPAEGCPVPDCGAMACAECAPHAGRWLSTSTPWLEKEEEEEEEEEEDEEYDDEHEAEEEDDEAPVVAAAEQEVLGADEGVAELAAQAEDEAPPADADAEDEIDPALRLVAPADGRWVCNRTIGDYRGNNYNQLMDRYF